MDKTIKFALPSPNFNKNIKDAGKPKPHFLTPSGMSLLPREKQPPPMYGKYGATVPSKFLTLTTTSQRQFEEQPDKQYCESCELELQCLEDFKRHLAQHEKCPVIGCQYKGHPSMMDKHVNTLHASGLFDKFKKLSTPEEIAAWREERKKRYPTLANVLLKQKAHEQRQKRGERLEANKNRFGKVNDRKRAQVNQTEFVKEKGDKVSKQDIKEKQKNKRNRKNNRNQKSREPQNKSEVKKKAEDIKSESSDIYCDGVKMFRGTGQMMAYKHLSDKNCRPTNNVLFSLVGMYGSDDDSDESEDQPNAEVEDATISLNSEFIGTNNDVNMIDPTNNLENCETIESDQNENPLNVKHNEKDEKVIEKLISSSTVCQKDEKVIEKLISSSTVCQILTEKINIIPAIAETTADIHVDPPSTITEDSADEAPVETPIQRSIDYPIKSEKLAVAPINAEPLTKRSKFSKEDLTTKIAKRKSGLDYRKLRLRKQNTMLEKLIETDIRHERNVLLQCVRYVCENNYFGVVRTTNTKPD